MNTEKNEVAAITGTTESGFRYTLPPDALDDYELLENLCDIDNGDAALFSLEQLKSWFGDGYVAPRLSIKTYNGDDVAQEVHFYAPEIWKDGIFQYFYPTNREGKMRVNYRLEYVYGDNS